MSARTKAALLGGSSTFDAVSPQAPISARGRALAALDGKPVETPVGPVTVSSSRVRIEQLAHNPYNPRETLTEIKEMADSIEVHGIIQPLTVVTRDAFLRAHPGQDAALAAADFVVLDGNRRLAGAHLAGLDELPIHVDDAQAETADDMLESALVAAVQHVDIEPLDQAKALERLVVVHGSQRQVAKRLGKSHVWVSQRLALLNLTPELQQAVEEKALPVEVARTVGRLPQVEQEQAVEQALERRTQAPKRQRNRSPEQPTPPAGGGNAVSTPTPHAAQADLPEQREQPAAEPRTAPVQRAADLSRLNWQEAEIDELADAICEALSVEKTYKLADALADRVLGMRAGSDEG
ncbi:plasmid partitioning protein [Kitasatospora herbaricolor]|uniref:ParB/RepB/Spo0J family partition protein n=1 Tax=Kitasatospora herbaricolor TaxID=68217 RepID=UPI00174DC776|nr:ParB/RepB/Spo0J family partition protein [Kitasatospora herbaricolor]MDQ0305499.1 ParB family chromosome partitioning protein [Kitasatospora herbaricolor]GGV51067.1 plasmid partitioning protein [Kitasatospora herbaricolor]